MKQMKTKLKIRECISLLKEFKGKYIHNGYKQHKNERKKVLTMIRPSVEKLREGENTYRTISDHILYHYEYDDAIKVLEDADWFSRHWPYSLVKRIELTAMDIIGPLLFISLGIVCLIFGSRDVRLAKESLTWPLVTGIITESRIQESGDSDDSITVVDPIIEYSYTVSGKKYSNDNRTYRSFNEGEEWARNVIKRYPKGLKVKVYYKPEAPKFSVLEREEEVHWSTYGEVIFGYVFIVLSVGFFLMRSICSIRSN